MNEERLNKAKVALDQAAASSSTLVEAGNGQDSRGVIDQIWRVQSKLEYAILMLKMHVGEDQIYKKPSNKSRERDYRVVVKEVYVLAKEALDHLKTGNAVEALRSTRKGRDQVRDLLSRLRRAKP